MRADPLSSVLRVRLTPSGGSDRIEGRAKDAAGVVHVKARVRAAPEKGEANAALEALLAKALGVPKSKVRVVRGATARLKSVEVDLDGAVVDAYLAGLPNLSKIGV